MNNTWAFLPMRSSADLLGDAAALQARLAEDGYLYLPQVLDRQRVLDLQRQFVAILHRLGWLKRPELAYAVPVVMPRRENDETYLEAYDELQRVEAFHSLAHDPALLEVMRQVLGPTAFPHPLKIVRMAFPDNWEVSTPPHQDYPNNQGTPQLTAAWVPLGDVPTTSGSLAVLRGSQRFGVLPLDAHPGAGNRQAVVPDEMVEQLHWVTTDFEAGDVLLFGSMTVHASLHNASELMRLSVDFRYQPEGEALTPVVLEPHYQRQTWDQIYQGWASTELQYYWRGLDYEVVPFQELPLASPELDSDSWTRQLFRHDRALTRRHQRRMLRLGELTDEEALRWPA